MAHRFQLKFASVVFAVLWTLGMAFWNGTTEIVPLAMLIVCGALAGVGWYVVMKRVQSYRPTPR